MIFKNKIFSITYAIISIILITYLSGTVWQVSESNISFSVILIIVTMALVLYLFITNKKIINLKQPSLLLLLVMSLIFMVAFVTNSQTENINFYITMIIYLLFSYLFTTMVDLDKFTTIFNVTMVTVTLISLVYYFILNYTEIYLNYNIIVSNNNINYYQRFLFFHSYSIDRNIAIFWEPGVFASILLFGLLLQIISKKFNLFVTLVYIVGILSTRSSAGIVLLVPIIILFVINNKKLGIERFILYILIFTTIGIFFVYNLDKILEDTIIVKLLEFDFNDMRVQTMYFNIDLFFKKPIFGHGFTHVNQLSQNTIFSSGGVNLMQTSTMTYFLASSGLIGFGYTILWIIGVFKLKNNSKLSRTIIFIVIFAILNKEIHASILVTNIIFFYLYKDNFKRWEKIDYGKQL